MSDSITIISPTRRPHMIRRLIHNYTRQVGSQNQYLIICLHGIEPFSDDVKLIDGFKNITLLHFDAYQTLGDILNQAALEVQTPFVCKWDDDDFYGTGFLSESISALQNKVGDLVGKAGWRAWMESSSQLYTRFPQSCDRYSTYLAGGTLACSTNDWIGIGFPSLNLGEDQAFVKRFINLGRSVWATSVYNYVQCRSINSLDHTWNISDKDYLVGSQFLSSRLDFSLIDKEF